MSDRNSSILIDLYLLGDFIKLHLISRATLIRARTLTLNVHAMAKPESCHARVMSNEMVRLYLSMMTCGDILHRVRSGDTPLYDECLAFHIRRIGPAGR